VNQKKKKHFCGRPQKCFFMSAKRTESETHMKYVCDICGYVYDPASGTTFEDLPEDWACPDCGVGKDQFSATA